jgi:hypothetical protein
MVTANQVLVAWQVLEDRQGMVLTTRRARGDVPEHEYGVLIAHLSSPLAKNHVVMLCGRLETADLRDLQVSKVSVTYKPCTGHRSSFVNSLANKPESVNL